MIYINLTLKPNSYDLLFLEKIWLYSKITESILLFTEKIKTNDCQLTELNLNLGSKETLKIRFSDFVSKHIRRFKPKLSESLSVFSQKLS